MSRGVFFAAAISIIALFTGCRGPHFGDTQGWSSSQKRDFESILASDRYASLCELKPLYDQYRSTGNTAILSRILTGYVRNLANSCVDIDAYKRVEKEKNRNKIHTHQEFKLSSVSDSRTLSQLRSGYSIEEILTPYIPKNPIFHRLLAAYRSGDRSRKLRMSLERSKLLDDEGWDNTYFVINVPEFRLRFIDRGQMAMSFPVITGKRNWQTPIFSAYMKYVVLNPAWNVPDNIARREEIPKLLKNPNYLKRKNMVVRRSYDIDSTAVDPSKVDWKKYLGSEYKHKEIPYKLIQKASSRNALGKVKFMFPNRYSVYMHDTPRKSLFRHSKRAFSHGCIRLSKPLELLYYLSDTGYLKKSTEEIKEMLKKGKRRYVNLVNPIPVHVVYMTAYPDNDGSIRQSADVYGFDSSMQMKRAR